MHADLGRHAAAADAARLELAQRHALARLERGDGSLWSDAPDVAAEIGRWLGWLPVVDEMRARVDELRALERGPVLVCGMGGSSLAPLVFGEAFGVPLDVLDSTHPAAVAAVSGHAGTIVIASKSGTTLEPMLFEEALLARAKGDGGRFVAITDPGTQLVDRARRHGFRATFENRPDIGGRYSALSLFGLVPAALAGVDVGPLLDGAATLDRDEAAELGAIVGGLGRSGVDKLTIVASPTLGRIGLWVEQLVAESTGKHGHGIVPVGDEPIGAPEVYGGDRLFVHLRADDADDAALARLRAAGFPVVTLDVGGPPALGREMLRLEIATALAGALIGINPFDQPDVQAAKDMTVAALAAYERDGSLGPAPSDPLADVLAGLESGRSYLAILPYLPPTRANDERLQRIRTALRDRYRVATQLGYGPRYLHSTGQLHKGGPPIGHFVQVVDEPQPALPIAGRPYGFETVVDAQARGDDAVLRRAGRPIARVTLDELEAAAR